MREFGDINSFVSHLAVMEIGVRKGLESGLERVAKKVEKSAKAELGTYQPEVGPFQDWADLADSTKEQRVSQGYTEDDPGLRNGKMRDSIKHQVDGLEAQIGSNDDKLVYFEFGTDKQPPRPVLGPAVVHNNSVMKKILGGAVVGGLIGGDAIHSSLGYDHEI